MTTNGRSREHGVRRPFRFLVLAVLATLVVDVAGSVTATPPALGPLVSPAVAHAAVDPTTPNIILVLPTTRASTRSRRCPM